MITTVPAVASVTVEKISVHPAKSTAWRALLWKEWREVWPLAAVTFALLIPTAWWDLGPTNVSGYNQIPRSFVNEMHRGFLIIITLSAIACGLLQFLRDRGPDAWGYIAHRAVTRSTWFNAKILVGAGALLAAWLLAAGVVAVGCVWPGITFVPMLPEFLAWSVGVVCVGLAAYAAGIATALGNGRWWASRCFPLALIFTLASDFGEPALCWSIPTALMIALVLMLIARADWLAGPHATVRRGWWLTTAPTWYMAIIIVGFADIVVSGIIDGGPYENDSDNWTLDDTCRPLLLMNRGFDTTLADEEGHLVAGPIPAARFVYLESSGGIVHLPVNIWTFAGTQVVQVDEPPYSATPNVLTSLTTRADIIAYSRLTRRRVPFQSPDGPVLALHGRLSGSGPLHTHMIFDADGILGLDDETLVTRRIFTARRNETAYATDYNFYHIILGKVDPTKPRPQFPHYDGHVIQTDQRTLIVRAGQPDAEIPPLLAHQFLLLVALDDGRLATIAYDHEHRMGNDPLLTIFDPTGKVISTRRLTRPANLPPILPRPSSITTLTDYMVPVPLDLLVIAEQSWKPDDANRIIAWPIIVVGACLHLIAVIIARHRCRRHDLSAATTRRWTILVAITSWPGLIVFAVHADLPRMTTCPRCAQSRSIATDLCGNCGGTWPDPPQLDAAGMAI